MVKITYQDLFSIYREEKGSNALVNISEDFDQSVDELISTISQKTNEDSQAIKELENAKKLIIQIIQLRRQKIIMRSISSQDAKLMGANEREQEFYEKMLRLCIEQDEWVRNLISQKRAKVENSSKTLVRQDNTTQRTDEQKHEKDDQKVEQTNPNTQRLKFLQPVPAYAGADGKNYGPFEVGDIANMPENEAQWMIDKKMADYHSHEN
jgi:DNA replication initiation complex subunit (GINS family)